MRIVLFGGAFDPPHCSHRALLLSARDRLHADKLIVIPTGDPPHKEIITDKRDRLGMACAAFGDIAEISDFELNEQGRAYTVVTAKHFRELYPDDEIFLLVGGDSIVNFSSWYCPQEIPRYVKIAAAGRAGYDFSAAAEEFRRKYGELTEIGDAPPGLSSTELRLKLNFGMDTEGLIPSAVRAYIDDRGLYSGYRVYVDRLRAEFIRSGKPERFLHTYYVVKAGLLINKYAKLPERKVFTACLLHDCAKYMTREQWKEYGYTGGYPDPVQHAFLGARVAERDYGITDPEILSAIRYHCTGRPDMTALEKLVYVADICDETRGEAVNGAIYGKLYGEGLEAAFIETLTTAWKYIVGHASPDNICPLTSDTIKFYIKEE